MKCYMAKISLQCSLRGWPGMCCWFSIDPTKALPEKETDNLYIEFKFEANLNTSSSGDTSQSSHNVSKVDRPTVCNVDSCKNILQTGNYSTDNTLILQNILHRGNTLFWKQSTFKKKLTIECFLELTGFCKSPVPGNAMFTQTSIFNQFVLVSWSESRTIWFAR